MRHEHAAEWARLAGLEPDEDAGTDEAAGPAAATGTPTEDEPGDARSEDSPGDPR
jgi:hypothetical protein